MRESDGDSTAGGNEAGPRTLPHSAASGRGPLALPGVGAVPEKSVHPRRRNDTQVSTGTSIEHEILKAAWKTTEKKLEVRNLELSNDALRLTTRLSLLEEELDAASRQAGAFREGVSKERTRWRVAAAGGAISLVLLCAVSWWTMHAGTVTGPSANSAVVGQGGPRQVKAPQRENKLPADPSAALTTAIDRLDDALGSARKIGISTDEALRRASANGKGCLMVWRDDLPSVLFGRTPVRGNSLANTLADCAQAVSRLR